ncbi:MAG TPA: hypothetical protein VJ483_08340 [Holophagaceae bacterium]|nr:hypothetical protein [Holophagaceae bacterium]
MNAAETALSLLFKKLHPHLEDAAHALERGAPEKELNRLHLKLQLARHKVVEVLEAALEAEDEESELGDLLDTLSANLTPVGENYQQSLILTQLCLEEAPKDLLPFVPAGTVASSGWGPRMVAFLAQLEDPAFEARRRWDAVPEEVGETEEE